MDFSYDCFVSSRDLLSILVEQIQIIIAAIMFFFFGKKPPVGYWQFFYHVLLAG